MDQHKPNLMKDRLRSAFELISIVAPIVCLIDCVVIPIALVLLPFIGIQHVVHGLGDQAGMIILFALCAPSLIPGYLKHRNKQVIALACVGFAFAFLGSLVSDIDEALHIIMTVSASIFLIKANLENRRLTRSSCCDHQH